MQTLATMKKVKIKLEVGPFFLGKILSQALFIYDFSWIHMLFYYEPDIFLV